MRCAIRWSQKGRHQLAEQGSTFVNQMPIPRTEKHWLAYELMERARQPLRMSCAFAGSWGTGADTRPAHEIVSSAVCDTMRIPLPENAQKCDLPPTRKLPNAR
jgi:hypothetical protein